MVVILIAITHPGGEIEHGQSSALHGHNGLAVTRWPKGFRWLRLPRECNHPVIKVQDDILTFSVPAENRPVGLVVETSASRAADPGFDFRLRCGDFPGRVKPVT